MLCPHLQSAARLLVMGAPLLPGAAALLLLLSANVPAAGDDGCWVHAFGREQFRPPVTTYTGPSQQRVFIKQARSLIVGPGARLVGYRRGEYQAQAQTLEIGPGERIAELASIDFHRRVQSFEVVCTSERR